MTNQAKARPPLTLLLAAALVGLALVSAGPSAAAILRAPPAAQLQEDGTYDVKTEVVGDCFAGKECTATITITAKGEFHVNDTYPFKFTAGAPNVEFHGAAGNVFSGGDFTREKTRGVMTVKFKPAAKGSVTIAGKYKICICSDKICSPSTIDVSIPVTVK